MDTPPASNTRSRASKLAVQPRTYSTPPSAPKMATTARPAATSKRQPPFLPTRIETHFFALFPAVLVFGTLFSVLSPQTREAPFDAVSQAHMQDSHLSPSYFAQKS